MRKRAQPLKKRPREPRGNAERSRTRQRQGWLETWIDHLGTVSDPELARRAGVSPDTVTLERRRRGIRPYQPHSVAVDWTQEMIALLGTASDSRIARTLGVGKDAVTRKRKLLGIPPFHRLHLHPRSSAFPWTPEALALLGRQSDRQVAKRLGISNTVVQRKRQELGIPPFQPARRFRWTAEMLELLGKVHDEKLAERFGISPVTVFRKRHLLGIPPRRLTRASRRPVRREPPAGSAPARESPRPAIDVERRPARRRFDWPEELVALLGRVPDKELARRAGFAVSTVRTERQRRGIAACHAKRGRVQWTPEMISRLGTASDREVAQELGIPRGCVRWKRSLLRIPPYHPPPRVNAPVAKWTPKRLALLGKVTDKELARRMRISPTTVTRRRQELGIPPFRTPARRIEWSEEMVALLGKVPDSAVAERYGISSISVFRKRAELGIPPYLNTHSVVRTPELAALLELPTLELELRTGLHRSTILRLRRELGIAAGPPSPKSRRQSSARRRGGGG